MIEKVNEAGLKLRFVILMLFILFSLAVAVYCFCQSNKNETTPSVMAFWPPDMVPHPPHFPDPNPPPDKPVMG